MKDSYDSRITQVSGWYINPFFLRVIVFSPRTLERAPSFGRRNLRWNPQDFAALSISTATWWWDGSSLQQLKQWVRMSLEVLKNWCALFSYVHSWKDILRQDDCFADGNYLSQARKVWRICSESWLNFTVQSMQQHVHPRKFSIDTKNGHI